MVNSLYNANSCAAQKQKMKLISDALIESQTPTFPAHLRTNTTAPVDVNLLHVQS